MSAYAREIADWCGVAVVPAATAFAIAAAVTGDLSLAVIVGGLAWLAVLVLFALEEVPS